MTTLTTQEKRLYEFRNLFNVTDLLPFFKLKGFWDKINLKFFQPIYNIPTNIVVVLSCKKITNKIMTFIQGFKPV